MPRARMVRWIRTLPIAWRIPLVVALNLFIALAVGGLGWYAALTTNADIDTLRVVQHRTAALADIDIRASRLQGLIRQYLANPNDDLLKEAMRESEALFVAMGDATAHENPLSDDAVAMHEAARQFVAGFQTLKAVNADIVRLYESQVLQTTSEMSGLFAILNSTARTASGNRLAPALIKSHETFVETLIAINVFYFNATPARAAGAHAALRQMVAPLPGLADLAGSDLQRDAITVLSQRSQSLSGAIDTIARGFEERNRILSSELDPHQATMSAAIDRLITRGRAEEERLRRRSRDQLTRLAVAGAAGAAALLVVGAWISLMIGQSIRAPLLALHRAMAAGADGDWSREVEDADMHDELAAMARTVAVFRRNAVEKARLEAERAETERLAGDANHRLVLDLLARIEAGEAADQTEPAVPAPVPAAGDTAISEITDLFNRLNARHQGITAERDAMIARLSLALDALRRAGREDAAFLSGLRRTLRPLIERLAANARPDENTASTLLVQFDRAMTYAELGPEGAPPVPHALPLAPLIDDLIGAPGGGGTVTAFVDPGIPTPLLVDSQRLVLLLGSLLDNARRFGGGGPVRLFAERSGPIGGGRLDVVLRVVDLGPGLAPSLAGHLFQPFAAAAGPDGRPPGIGLGLATARRLATSLNGEIAVDSRPALGTTVRLRLPFGVAPGRCEADPEPVSDGLSGRRVLVAVPDPDERGLIALVTEQAGAAVVRVPGAREALAASRRASRSLAPFDLIVAAAEALDESYCETLGSVPLLVVDADESDTRFRLERLPGCVGFLGRPLGRRQILSATLHTISLPFGV